MNKGTERKVRKRPPEREVCIFVDKIVHTAGRQPSKKYRTAVTTLPVDGRKRGDLTQRVLSASCEVLSALQSQ